MRRAAPPSERAFALAVTALYAAAVALSILGHEPWRDEVDPWLLARDSSGLGALLGNNRYNGHPVLWHLLLMPLTRVGSLGLMHALNAALMAGAVYLFARFAPFARRARLAFALGYLPLYEYGTIARNYGVGVLLLFAFAALFPLRRRHPALLGLVLALAANTSAHAAVVAGGAGLLLALDWSATARGLRAPAPAMAAALGLAGLGLVAALFQVVPPPDGAVAEIWAQRPPLERLGGAAASLVHGFAPVPFPRPLEDTALAVLQAPEVALGAGVVLLFLPTALLALAGRPRALAVSLAPMALLLVAFYARYYGGARHAGFMWVAVLVGLWVAPELPARAPSRPALARAVERATARLPRLLGVVLGFHVAGAALAVAADLVWVYSGARATAALIRAEGLSERPLVAAPDWAALNVVAHLDAKRAFYANVDRWGSFLVQDARHAGKSWAPAPSDAVLFDRARKVALNAGEAAVVVVNRAAAPEVVAAQGIRLVGVAPADVYRDESFWVYEVPVPR